MAPDEWKGKYKQPVVPLILALYGHPSAGDCWEEYAETRICSLGFRKIEGWPSTFLHPKTKALLIVYVDDFKLAAPKDKIKDLWKQLGGIIKLGPAVRMDRFIGCEQEEFTCPVSALLPILELAPELHGERKRVKARTVQTR